MKLEDLKNNPLLISVNLKIQGPAGLQPTSTLSINSTMISPESTKTYAETIDMMPNAVVAGRAELGALQGDAQFIQVSASGTANCYWLPWGNGKVYLGQLGTAYDYFFTYTINGCGVLIGGTQAQPIVVHANLNCKRLNDAVEEAMKQGGNIGENIAHAQAIIYDQFYGNLAARLIQDNRLSGARLEVVTPQQYLVDAKAGFGAVFGINNAGSWEFYGNWAKHTTKIWP